MELIDEKKRVPKNLVGTVLLSLIPDHFLKNIFFHVFKTKFLKVFRIPL
jgi:hypothetical protein